MAATQKTVDGSVDENPDSAGGETARNRKAVRKRGAQPGNKNTLTHGLDASHGLRAGRLPKGCGYIVRAVNDFTRSFNRALIAQKGEVSFTDAASVNSATRWERHSCLALRWLRLHCETMTHDQRLTYSREIAKASAERDKCIRATGLAVCDVTDGESIYGAGFPVIDVGDTVTTTAPAGPSDATGGDVVDVAGDAGGIAPPAVDTPPPPPPADNSPPDLFG
jgi:hypothetical protein